MIDFEEKLKETLFIHEPLDYVCEESFETFRKKIEIKKKRILFKGKKLIKGKTKTVCFPEGMPADGDYAYYGDVKCEFDFDHEDWSEYDRLSYVIEVMCDGVYVPGVTVGFVNEGKEKVPDKYFREGCHMAVLSNHCINHQFIELGSMARDEICRLTFAFRQNGREMSGGEEIKYRILEISLEKTASPALDSGWATENSFISYATTGYLKKGIKTAVTDIESDKFYIVSDDTLTSVFEGKPKKEVFYDKKLFLLDFSGLELSGRFHIVIDKKRTPMFVIDDGAMDNAVWKCINFLFTERCGYPVPGRHGTCHMDVYAEHNGVRLPYCGGWHDAGDLSQQTAHTAEGAAALIELAFCGHFEKKGLLKKRLLEEGRWGIDFLLRTRFGDGFRATSAGLVRWTDGLLSNEDDVPARSHDHAVDNLLCAAVLARAAEVFSDSDKDFSLICKNTAIADFKTGIDKYEKCGMELPCFWEHTYGIGISQCEALVAICASGIYKLTGEKKYAEYAKKYVKRVIACQERDKSLPTYGAFYRDRTKKALIHSAHQSREYLCVLALSKGYEATDEPDLKKKIKESVRLYGKYLKLLFENSSPYGMFPAGVYHIGEADDKDTFERIHLQADFDTEKEHYINQLRAGKDLGNGYYLRQFPVWFSFRGNGAIHLSFGRAAGIVGNFLGEREYLDMAAEQLYWINGKNPSLQSLQYGEGRNYASQYAPLPGEMIGEMPVGIQTKGDLDEPYYPYLINATYKEVWTSVANRWLMVLKEVFEGKDTYDQSGNG
ncbi:MAG: glycoside hydrolase family 9 protein [Acetatifactor sp.]|nr:glycoside hydrolase family 9 protein [Acetatifactor sp.]